MSSNHRVQKVQPIFHRKMKKHELTLRIVGLSVMVPLMLIASVTNLNNYAFKKNGVETQALVTKVERNPFIKYKNSTHYKVSLIIEYTANGTIYKTPLKWNDDKGTQEGEELKIYYKRNNPNVVRYFDDTILFISNGFANIAIFPIILLFTELLNQRRFNLTDESEPNQPKPL